MVLTLFVCQSQEAESKPQCRRLQLKDIIPTEMQRLTKYPLLLEHIAKNTGMCVYYNSLFVLYMSVFAEIINTIDDLLGVIIYN